MEFIKKYKKIFIVLSASLLLALLCLYLCAVMLLPALLNSGRFIKKAENFIYNKTGALVSVKNLDIKATRGLSYYIKADKITATKNGLEFLNLEDFSAKVTFNKLKYADGKYLYVNLSKFKKNTKKKNDYKISLLPDIYFEGADIIFDETKDFKGSFSNLSLKEINDKRYLKFYGEISSSFLKESLKTGENGYFVTNGETILAQGFEILSKDSKIALNGKIYDKSSGHDFYIDAKNLPVDDTMASVLYYQKSKDPSKKFIENFVDYKGTLDISLNFKENGIFGKCVAKELGAKSVLFNAPVFFENAEFIFDKQNVNSTAYGTLAEEKVRHILRVTNILRADRETYGSINSTLASKAGKYIPDLSIKNGLNIEVEYFIKNKIITVDYLASIKKGADIFYKGAFLGLRNKDRRVFVHTIKNNKILYIKNYDYSVLNNGEAYNIVLGDGLFIKLKEKMKPKYLSARTNGFAPASVTGSFGKFISGGEFSGDLKYDFLKNKIFGNFIIKNARHKDFYIENAQIKADKKCIDILAKGKYKGEKFVSKMQARNRIGNKITIYNMDLFLDKYIEGKKHFHPKKDRLFAHKIKDFDLTIENWKIRVNKIVKDRIVLNNVLLAGSLKNSVFKFQTSDISFAKGVLSAKGLYNFKKKSSGVRFSAKNVDSNIAADLIFNLPNQVAGTANGVLYIKTFNKLDDIKAKLIFRIDKGYMPQLGDIEIKNRFTRKKIKLSNLIKVRNENNEPINPAEYASDIMGSLYVNNSKLENILITSKQKNLSLLIEGNCNLEEDSANLMMFGKYSNDKHRKIKILFMPFSFVAKLLFRPENTLENYKDKFNKVPDVNTNPANVNLFRIKLDKKPGENNTDIEMKRIY